MSFTTCGDASSGYPHRPGDSTTSQADSRAIMRPVSKSAATPQPSVVPALQLQDPAVIGDWWARVEAPRWLTAPSVMLLLMLALVVGIQVSVGALRSERGLYSDEAAHLMNGLVIRDYVRDGLGQNPLTFARDYYQHYPKIAPLMWPPLFHVLLGGVLLPGWSPTIAALVLLGMFTTWIAWRLYFIVLTFASVPVAIGTVGLFLATPAVIRLTSSVMLDIAVAAFAMEAAYWLGRFSYSGRTRDAVWFGLMTAFACIT
jgi:hypothetical protein